MEKRGSKISCVSSNMIVGITIVVLSCLLSPSSADGRNTAKIVNNTIVADDGTLLRGGTFWIYGWMQYKTTWALSPTPWKHIKENGFNAMRIACGYRVNKEGNYSLDQYDIILDSLFKLADLNDIYLIIDFHDTPGTYNMASAREFWNRYSKRYKDRGNAIFELTNEPKFDQPHNYQAENLRDFEELWKICDKNSPATPQIILTFCQVGYSKELPEEVADSLRGIDWKKTAVGFHSYWRDSSERIVGLKKKYPCINTEFMTYSGTNELKKMDGHAYHGTLMEKLKISWLQWDILDREPSVTEKLPKVIQDLKDNNVYWVPQIGLQKGVKTMNVIQKTKKTGVRHFLIDLVLEENPVSYNQLVYFLNGRVNKNSMCVYKKNITSNIYAVEYLNE